MRKEDQQHGNVEGKLVRKGRTEKKEKHRMGEQEATWFANEALIHISGRRNSNSFRGRKCWDKLGEGTDGKSGKCVSIAE